MEYPHCLKSIYVKDRTHFNFSSNFDGSALLTYIGVDTSGYWWLEKIVCPACQQFILTLVLADETTVVNAHPQHRHLIPMEGTEHPRLIYPRLTGRPPIPPEVPEEFTSDYREACLGLADSPKASAALSRRCLQLILRKELEAQGRDLYKEIQWAIQHGNLPSSVIELLDVPRKVENEAAHPTLSDAGLISDVEPWEAEWCLEIIEALYDYIFVLPAKNQERLGRLGQQQSSGSHGT